MRRYTLYLLLFLAVSPVNVLHAQTEGLFSEAPRDDNGRFTNQVGEISHGTLGTRFPFILRRFGTYFRNGDGAPLRVPNDGAFLRENVRNGKPTVTWVGHATLLVQIEGITFLTDPTWSNRPSPVPLIGPRRYVAPGIAFEDMPPIDFVLISHNHYDHLDLPTLRDLAKRNVDTVFFVPLGNGDLMRGKGISNVRELNWGHTATYKGVTIHCLPSQHWSKRSLNDDHKALWASWAVTGEQRRFYFAGDTGYFSGFEEIGRKLGPFDLAAVPIGAYEPKAMMRESHMNPEEAIRAAQDLNARRAMAIHFGTFDLSDEPLAEPPKRFRQAAEDTELGLEDAWILDVGQTREF
ncbi:MAG: MBL fold metallo-hydrolase [Halioglobus sp.]